MSQGFVYILQSTNSFKYYIGASTDVNNRLFYHNNGWVTATRKKGPWEIKFIQSYPTIKEAKQIEYKLKKSKSHKLIEQIIAENIIKIGA